MTKEKTPFSTTATESKAGFEREIWGREADYVACLCQEIPKFPTSYQFFFPPGAIEAVLSYYGLLSFPSDSDELMELQGRNVPLFRRLIYHLASSSSSDEEESFFHSHPLPHQSFLVTSEDVELFNRLWENSVPTFFTGRVNPDFLPQRDPRGTGKKKFATERERLILTYRQRHPNLDRLIKLHPHFLYCLEAYYFQGKSLGIIALEERMKRDQVYFDKELALQALGIAQGSEGQIARRYKFWLGPALKRWEENARNIAGLPPALQEIAWELLKGVRTKTVAQKFGVSYKDLLPLRQQLLSGNVERKALFSQERLQAIQELSTLPYDQQPIVHLTQAVLEAKAQGNTYAEIRQVLGLDHYQIGYLLKECLEDLRWAFPNSPDISSIPRKRLTITSRQGQQLSSLYRRFTEKMVQNGCCLTPRQEEFLEQAQANLPFAAGRFLVLYLKSSRSRWANREERVALARAVLIRLSDFSPEDQERIVMIAGRVPLSKIFPGAEKDQEFLRLFRQIQEFMSP